MNVTTPPATGSAALLAETETASGLAKVVPARRALRRAAGDRRQGESLALEGADVDGAVDDPRLAALVGMDSGRDQAVAAGIDGGAAGEQGHGRRRPAIVAQRSQDRTGETGQDDVAADAVADPARTARSR